MNEEARYLEVITDLGFRSQEAKILLATFSLGQATVREISETAKIQRTFAYDVLKDLKEKGLVSQVEISGKIHFSAVSVERFKKIQQEKLTKFQKIIPELKTLEKTIGDKPRVRFFEGSEGIKEALEDTLLLPIGSEILAYATAEGFYTIEKEWTLDYIKRRVAKRISMRSITPSHPANIHYTLHNTEHMRSVAMIPQDKFPFTNEIDIYGNKIIIISVIGELLAVIIESESIAKTQRSIFELAWLGAKSISNLISDKKDK